jgi:hypothetical protein
MCTIAQRLIPQPIVFLWQMLPACIFYFFTRAYFIIGLRVAEHTRECITTYFNWINITIIIIIIVILISEPRMSSGVATFDRSGQVKVCR